MPFHEFFMLYSRIMANNSWLHTLENAYSKHPIFKYVDFTVDTRTGEVYQITLRSGNEAHHFRLDNPDDLKKLDALLG